VREGGDHLFTTPEGGGVASFSRSYRRERGVSSREGGERKRKNNNHNKEVGEEKSPSLRERKEILISCQEGAEKREKDILPFPKRGGTHQRLKEEKNKWAELQGGGKKKKDPAGFLKWKRREKRAESPRQLRKKGGEEWQKVGVPVGKKTS